MDGMILNPLKKQKSEEKKNTASPAEHFCRADSIYGCL